MVKCLHKVFSTIVSEIFQELTNLGDSGMKWETSEPDSPKLINSWEIYFIIVLNTLCKPFPMLRVAFNATFQSDCLCLIRSRILQRASLLLMVGWVWFPSQMSYNVSVDIRSWSDCSFESSFSISCSFIISDSLSDSSPLSVSLQVPVNISPSQTVRTYLHCQFVLLKTSHMVYMSLPDASPSPPHTVMMWMTTY